MVENWKYAYYHYDHVEHDNAPGDHCVTFEFNTKEEAEDFLRTMMIHRDVEDELKDYETDNENAPDEGLKRTVSRK